jgi:Short C-terminal domain
MMRRMGRPGLLGLAARTAVVAGTATAVAGGVANHQEQRVMQQQAAQQQAPQPEPAPAPAPSSGDGENSTIEQLKELASLKDQGILTEEEFEAQKAKVLGG